MEFMSRGRTNTHAPAGAPGPSRRGGFMGRLMRIELFTVIVGSALLLAAVAVYFGKIQGLNNKYVDLTNVFYIENNASTGTQTQSTNYTLRKLGTTELHSPEDEMIINRDQVTFWENLKDSSQVVTKINEYYKNPNASQTNTTDQGTQNQNTTSPQNTNTNQ